MPAITLKLLNSIDCQEVPSISNKLKQVQPPEKRKQIAFLFEISWYLGLCNLEDVLNIDTLIRNLKKQGFHAEKEFYDT